MTTTLICTPDGHARAIYSDFIALAALGELSITRASHVEPNAAGLWLADLSPIGGPTLGPYALRSAALAAEVQWLEQNWLCPRKLTAMDFSRVA